jgi:hypothetical protein
MQLRTITNALVTAAAALGLAFASPGCMTRGRGAIYVTDTRPPPPRHIEADYRPGYVYIQGRWEHRDRGWIWRDGYYSRERPGHVDIQGRWYSDGGRWRWSDGRWDRRVRHDEPRRRRHINDHRPR